MAETQLTLGDRGEIMRGSVTVAQMVVTNSNHSRMVQDRALFLTAPELLEALQTAMQWIKAWDVGFLFDEEWADDEVKIKAAIARATGAAS